MKLLIALALLAFPVHAFADDPKAAAREHVARATELHKANRFRDALDELKTAYALDPRPALLYAMGQMHVSLGECAQAITFYERFLATRPDPRVAALASEAIEACRTNPPPAVAGATAPSPDADAAPTASPTGPRASPPAPASPSPSASRSPSRPGTSATAIAIDRPWYGDHLADGLVLGGVVSSVVGLVVYRGAVADLDAARATSGYDAYAALDDRAHTKRAVAVGFGIAGVACITAGVLHLVLADHGASDHGVQLMATRGGGAVAWTGRF